MLYPKKLKNANGASHYDAKSEGSRGRTKAYYTSEEWADSVEFWQNYASLRE